MVISDIVLISDSWSREQGSEQPLCSCYMAFKICLGQISFPTKNKFLEFFG